MTFPFPPLTPEGRKLWPLYVCRACGLPVRDLGEGAPKECPSCYACTWIYQRSVDDTTTVRGPVLRKMVFKIMLTLRRQGRL